MTTVTGLTAERMLEIEAASVVAGSVNGDGDLILETHGGTTVNAGNVAGTSGDSAYDTWLAAGNVGTTDDFLASLGAGGYVDHGNQSGAVNYNGTTGTHALNMTGNTTVNLTGGEDGRTTSIWATGDFDLIVESVLVPSNECIAVMIKGEWQVRVIGGAGEYVDTTPPSQSGTITVTPVDLGLTVSWVAATDEVGVAGYEVQIDGGSWVDSGPDLNHTFTGLMASSSHSGAVRAYDAAGNRGTSRAWGPSTVPASSVPPVAGYNAFFDGLASSSITLASGKVTQWADQSGNNYHMTQATDANRPIVSSVGGKPVIDFGADDFLQTPTIPVTGDDGTLIVIAGYRTGGPSSNIQWVRRYGADNSQVHSAFMRPTNAHWNSIVTNGADTVIDVPTVDTLSFGAIAVQVEELAAGTCKSFVNGTAVAGSTQQGQFIPDGAGGRIKLNDASGTTVFFAAVINYPTKLTDAQIASIRSWAQTRYGTP